MFDRPTLWNLPASKCHLRTARAVSFEEFAKDESLVTIEERDMAWRLYDDVRPDADATEYDSVGTLLRRALRDRRAAADRFRAGRKTRYDWTRAAIVYEPRKEGTQPPTPSWHLPVMD